MKILLLSFEYPPYPLAGTGKYALNLSKNLQGHEVTVITPRFDESFIHYEMMDNIEVIRIDIQKSDVLNKLFPIKQNRSFIDRRLLFSYALRKFLRTIDLTKFDVIHVMTLSSSLFLDYRYLKQFAPVIISVNEYYLLNSTLNPFKFPMSTDFPIRFIHHNLLKEFCIRALHGCTKVIANARNTKRVIVKEAGVSQAKVVVIHRGIDLSKFAVEKIENGKYSSHRILFVGANMERKGGLHVLQAMPKILRSYPDAHLTLIGSGSFLYMDKIHQFIKKYKLEKNVELVNHVDHDGVLAYYKKANVFIMPSVLEALGQVYMESLMTKTPVIGTNTGGIPEVVTPEVGRLVPVNDPEAIAREISDVFAKPKMAEEMGARGKEWIEGYFNVPRMIEETVQAYQRSVHLVNEKS